jgi:hypothetical protein
MALNKVAKQAYIANAYSASTSGLWPVLLFRFRVRMAFACPLSSYGFVTEKQYKFVINISFIFSRGNGTYLVLVFVFSSDDQILFRRRFPQFSDNESVSYLTFW